MLLLLDKYKNDGVIFAQRCLPDVPYLFTEKYIVLKIF